MHKILEWVAASESLCYKFVLIFVACHCLLPSHSVALYLYPSCFAGVVAADIVVVGTAAVVEVVDIVVAAEVVGTVVVVEGFAVGIVVVADNDAVVVEDDFGGVGVAVAAVGGGFGTVEIVEDDFADGFADVAGDDSADAVEGDFADVGGGSGIAETVVVGDDFDTVGIADAVVGVDFYIVGSAAVEVDFGIVGAADVVVGVDFDIVEPGRVFVVAVNSADVGVEVFVSPFH